MKIKLLSHNVRGLNDPKAMDNLRHNIRKNPIDLFFIQEHKLRGKGVDQLGQSLWRRAIALCTEAAPGYTEDGKNAGKGGVASFLSPRWAKLIAQSGSLFGGREQWFILNRLPGGDVGFVNIYAPHESHSRRMLWEFLSRELPNTWIMIGDFNTVEFRADKSSMRGRTMPALERLIFNGLKEALQVSGPPRTLPSLIHS